MTALALQGTDLWQRCRFVREATAHTPPGNLMPVDQARALLVEIERAMAPIGGKAAAGLVRRMLACYPKLDAHDPQGYSAALTAELARMPAEVAAIVVDEVTATCRFLPTRADLHAAAAFPLRERIDAHAALRSHIEQHQQRARRAIAPPPPPPPRCLPRPPAPRSPPAPPPPAPEPAEPQLDPHAQLAADMVRTGRAPNLEAAWLEILEGRAGA